LEKVGEKRRDRAGRRRFSLPAGQDERGDGEPSMAEMTVCGQLFTQAGTTLFHL